MTFLKKMKQTENIKFKTAEKSDYKIQNQAEREELSFLAALNNSSILDKVAPIVAILEGMSTKENLTHKEVKSLVFHCISTINKAR